MKLVIYLSVIVCAFALAPVLQAQDRTVTKDLQKTILEDLPKSVSFADLLRGKVIKGLQLGAVSPNELKGFEFFGAGRLKGLRLGISTREEVVKALGASCEEPCRYDQNWNVFIDYFDAKEVIEPYTFDESGKQTLLPKLSLLPGFDGKIRLVRFKPRRTMLGADLVFTDEFTKSAGVSFGHDFDGSASGSITKTYTDGYGLQYSIFEDGYDTSRENDKSERRKGELLYIEYRVPRVIEQSLYVKQKP